ncbi:replication protein RepA [Sedimenticola selenatireducens]|uniref:replication protein RepA n=1 Tax=Sedimenticola selenatireducens TaxID=191960 RepID=UPI002AAB377D|nr:replication protein RepA [Sedimenticola selenatireducens]
MIDAGLAIAANPPGGNDLTFMHSIMCQVGLPRSKVDGFEFERICGGAGLCVRAGKLWDGRQFVQQPLPYGPMPRLVMAYLNTQALRHKSPEIEVGSSAREFLKRLGKDSTGGRTGTYTAFRKQIQALSACSMTLGFNTVTTAITYNGRPITQFKAWLANSDEQGTLWPGTITFSQEYYQTLTGHAVPLDLRAMNALTSSALAMDMYAMLADRLHRINGRALILHWRSLREQLGQEYTGPEADKNFKKKFLPALQKAMAVYPQAKVKKVAGGILMMPSPPPIPYRV